MAIKILPEAFAHDADRLARFQREAKTLASLNHPNIAIIHGFEQLGDVRALVMELVEGEDLSQRIARLRAPGASARQAGMPLDEALPIARQIAEALEAAHEQGIIHRDLKPANIKVRSDGTVKVLDFGLAKARMRATTANLADSPTLTSPAPMTEAGVILGTAPYMSPEQARGQEADRTTDIWAFGCVMYEMLAGRAVFAGNSASDVISEVLKSEPDWTRLPPDTPSGIRTLLLRCLRKDRKARLQHVDVALMEIDDVAGASFGAIPATHASAGRTNVGWRLVPWLVAMGVVGAVVAIAVRLPRGELPKHAVRRFEMNMPPGVDLGYTNTPNIAIAPDGSGIAFAGNLAGLRKLYVRRTDEHAATPVKGTETENTCAFSPDGRFIAFIGSDRTVKKLSIGDGLISTVVTDANYTGGGLAWGTDDQIIFGRGSTLWRVPASGGAAEELTRLDVTKRERSHFWPAALPDGTVIFTVVSGAERMATSIDAVSPTSRTRRRLVEDGRNAFYADSGHLVYFHDGSLLAARFDIATLSLTGQPVSVLDGIALDQLGSPMLSVSHTGLLAYAPSTTRKQLVWVSRQGAEQPITGIARPYVNVRLSPDGNRVAVELSGGDIWTHDLQRSTFTRLTNSDTLGYAFAVWMPDGNHFVARAVTGLFLFDAAGSTPPRALGDTTAADTPTSISPDGKTLAFIRQSGSTLSSDVYVLSLDGEPTARPIVQTPGYDGGAQFSPDGRWLSYVSNDSGQWEVFIRPYQGPDRKQQVSTQGGTHPKWAPSGKELFYRSGNKMMVVDVTAGRDSSLLLSAPRVLFEQRYDFGTGQTTANYDVSQDGQRFLMVKDDSDSGRLNVVLDWFDELKRLTGK